MKTISIDISDRDYKLLNSLAEVRVLTPAQLVREMVLESRQTIQAETKFMRRAMRGRGKEQRGRELLDKAVGIGSGDVGHKVPNAQSRAAIFETRLIGRLSNLRHEIIDDIDIYLLEYDEQQVRKKSKR